MAEVSFKLPDVGEGVVEAEVVTWKVAVGDTVTEDDHVADVMTDKATVEISAPVSGTVLRLACGEGEMLAVGSEMIAFATDGEAPADTPAPPTTAEATQAPPDPAPEHPKAEPPAPAPEPPKPAIPTPPRSLTTRSVPASPAVRRAALQAGIDLRLVQGSGPAGRVTMDDLRTAPMAEAHVAPSPGGAALNAPRHGQTVEKIKGLRRKIADRMAAAVRDIPHFSYVEEIDVTALEDLRRELNTRHADQRGKLTILPFLAAALARVLPAYPMCNATYDGTAEELTTHAPVHLGIATQTPGGLMVPVVKHAEALDLWICAAAIREVSEAARTGKAAADTLRGSTITISSLGALGGIVTTPVINAPETAIIGVNKLVDRPVVHGGQVVVRTLMNLSCSFDHRVVDGHDAASMVQDLRGLLECPALLLVN